jgi:hypothetical protein
MPRPRRNPRLFDVFLKNLFFGNIESTQWVLGELVLNNLFQEVQPQMIENKLITEPNLVKMTLQLVTFLHSVEFKKIDQEGGIQGESLIYAGCLERPLQGNFNSHYLLYPRNIAHCNTPLEYRYYLKEASVLVLLSKVLYLYGVYLQDMSCNNLSELLQAVQRMPYFEKNQLVRQGEFPNMTDQECWYTHNEIMQYVWLLANPLED